MSTKPVEDIESTINLMEDAIGLTRGFFRGLLKSHDWAFVIQLHALLESVIAHLINVSVGVPELAEVIDKLPFGGATSKRTVAKKLGIIRAEHDRFLGALGTIRNAFAHDPKNAGLSITAYWASIKPEARAEQIRAIAIGFVGESHATTARITMVTNNEQRTTLTIPELVEDSPAMAIWFAALILISVTYAVALKRTDLQMAAAQLQAAARAGPTP